VFIDPDAMPAQVDDIIAPEEETLAKARAVVCGHPSMTAEIAAELLPMLGLVPGQDVYSFATDPHTLPNSMNNS
jgi:hypothetical protein